MSRTWKSSIKSLSQSVLGENVWSLVWSILNMTNLPWMISKLSTVASFFTYAQRYFLRSYTSFRTLKSEDSDIRLSYSRDRNDILHKACIGYMAHLKVPMPNSYMNFIEINDCSQSDKKFSAESERLKKFEIYNSPCLEEWLKIESAGVEICLSHSELAVQKKERSQMQLPFVMEERNPPNRGDGISILRGNVLTFKASNPNGDDKISKFIESAKNWFIQKLESTHDENRYMYILQENMYFRRYALSKHKTFDTLFIKDKDSKLHLMTI